LGIYHPVFQFYTAVPFRIDYLFSNSALCSFQFSPDDFAQELDFGNAELAPEMVFNQDDFARPDIKSRLFFHLWIPADAGMDYLFMLTLLP